jgi:putative FmdB family regulatory protein
MPIYEYVCPDCKTKFELIRPFSKSSEPAGCPTCKHIAQRALSRFACFTKNDFDMTAPVGGGGGCASCGGGSCDTCNN